MTTNYNTYCTNWGCFRGYYRDDIDNGWPSWRPAPNRFMPPVSQIGIGLPQEGPIGQLKAPPLWHYTVPQNQESIMSLCGSAGCGPITIPVSSATYPGIDNPNRECVP
uniref:Uncharacterized protein n=1 Tax=viral metagenome TaxID=1070528 RepID=A0A6C0C009_9ZZZZ